MLRAAFFDRDGVLNVDVGYVFEPSRLFWRPTAKEAVKWLNDKGLLTFVVTNQSGVARGYLDADAVDGFHAHMQAELAAVHAHVYAFGYCPHHPEGVVAQFRVACRCRKAAAGMVLTLLDEYGLDASVCHFFGDTPSDLQAAAAAGMPATLVLESDALLNLVQRFF